MHGNYHCRNNKIQRVLGLSFEARLYACTVLRAKCCVMLVVIGSKATRTGWCWMNAFAGATETFWRPLSPRQIAFRVVLQRDHQHTVRSQTNSWNEAGQRGIKEVKFQKWRTRKWGPNSVPKIHFPSRLRNMISFFKRKKIHSLLRNNTYGSEDKKSRVK